jgi:glucan 1,3-beta-glucosidase
MFGGERPLRGVNLGGWLVLEKWITPSLFSGLKAQDEYSFCKELADEASDRLKQHRSSFISAKDFKWLAEQGIEAVRLPVGYWLFGSQPPFVGCRDYVDLAFEQAQKNGLKVALDLHAAPGSQNGNDHSGRAGEANWYKNIQNIEQTLAVIEKLVECYGRQPNFIGIELLNEPGWNVPFKTLRSFYEQAYEVVRAKAGSSLAVIVSDAFKPDDWFMAMPETKYENLVLDMHLYQVFTPEDRALDLNGHINKAITEWRLLITKLRRSNPVIIGEWSAALQYRPEGYINEEAAAARYVEAQINAFQPANGWFFWTYKTESQRFWSLRDCVPEILNLK